MRRSGGESSTGTQDTLVTHLIDRQWKAAQWRDGHGSQAIQRQWEKRQWKSTLCTETEARKANTAKERRARTKAKESTKVNTRAARSLRATESGDTSRKTVETRTLLLRSMRRSLSNLQTVVRAAARIESRLHLLVCFQLEPRSPRLGRSPR